MPEESLPSLHESVRDFLLKENGLADLWTDLGSDFRGLSHDILKQCCVTYIVIAISSFPDFAKPPPGASFTKARQSAARSFPFMEYAIQNVLYHADLAEEGHVSQLGFIERFHWPEWLELSNLFAEYGFYRHTPKASLLYIFAENDLSNLIEIHPSSFSYFELEDDRYGSPLYASIVTRSYRAVRKFLELEAQRQPSVPLLRRLLNQFRPSECDPSSRRFNFKRGPKALNLILSFCDGILAPFLLAAGNNMDLLCENWHSKLLAAISDRGEGFALQLLAAGINLQMENAGALILLKASTKGWEEVVKNVLTHRDVNVNFGNSHGLTPLGIAAQEGYVEIVKMLLDTKKVDVNSKDGKGRTPLLHAVRQGYKDITRLLLETGEVNINAESRYGETPLATASRKGYIEITRLLLGTERATVNFRDKFCRSPLSYVAERGYHDIAVLLLQSQNIDVDSKDNFHRTPLSYAAEQGHEKVVALLLMSPKLNLNSDDKSGWSSLFYAANRGHERVIKLLLLQDKVNANLRSNIGSTALIQAARLGHVAIVKLFLGRDEVDVNATTIWGVSALSMSRNMGHKEVVEILLASGRLRDREIGSAVVTTPRINGSKNR